MGVCFLRGSKDRGDHGKTHSTCSALQSTHCRVSSEWLVLTTMQELFIVAPEFTDGETEPQREVAEAGFEPWLPAPEPACVHSRVPS